MFDRNELDDLMDAWMDMMNNNHRWIPNAVGKAVPRTNVEWEDRNGEITVSMDMPGVEKKDIVLNVDTHMVTISAKKDDREYNVSKRFENAWLDPNKVKAVFNNGVLDISISKTMLDKGKTITIK